LGLEELGEFHEGEWMYVASLFLLRGVISMGPKLQTRSKSSSFFLWKRFDFSEILHTLSNLIFPAKSPFVGKRWPEFQK
jgi:hypothetical protein